MTNIACLHRVASYFTLVNPLCCINLFRLDKQINIIIMHLFFNIIFMCV